MSPAAFVLVLGIFTAMAGVAGFQAGVNQEKAEQLDAIKAAEKERDEAQELADQRSIGFEQVITYLNGQVRRNAKGWRDALDSPVYRDCKPDAVGLRILNEFIATANRSRQPDGTLPERGAAAGGVGHGRPDAALH